MEIAILAVGKLRPSFREACDDYLKRLGRYATIVEHQVPEASRAGSPAVQRREETARLLARLPGQSRRVALTRQGEPWSSRELAHQLEQWRQGRRPVAFLLGGSHGLDSDQFEAADQRWSLGPLTLPHELARVVVCEQLYRAFTILRGEPYHKGADS